MSTAGHRLFLDTATLALALGADHPLRDDCRRFLDGAADGTLEVHVSVEALQELLFHRLRRGPRAEAVTLVRDVRSACVVHAFDDIVALRMMDLVEQTSIGGRDAVHAATALETGFTAIVTPDRDFDRVPGLRRQDPADPWPG